MVIRDPHLVFASQTYTCPSETPNPLSLSLLVAFHSSHSQLLHSPRQQTMFRHSPWVIWGWLHVARWHLARTLPAPARAPSQSAKEGQGPICCLVGGLMDVTSSYI